MKILQITEIVLILILFCVGINTVIIFKKNGEDPIEKIKKPLIIRIDIIMALTIIIGVLTIISIILNR